MDRLLEILRDVAPDADVENETGFIDSGILDSFSLINLVSQINETFGVELRLEQLVPGNFNSAAAMWNMISRLLEEE